MKSFLGLILCFFLWANNALAKDSVVIELFTSQGCDKCPPAHVLQQDYSQMDEVIALTWHVEHWDFMGWRDTFADPEFSRRQYLYNKKFGRKGVYTPQAVVNGNEQIVASNKLELFSSIKKALSGNPTPLSVGFNNSGGSFLISLDGSNKYEGADVLLLWVKSEDRVKVNSGANIGKTFESMNIVRNLKNIGAVKTTNQTLSFSLADPDRGDSDMVAVLVQEKQMGTIVGAAMVSVSDMNN